MKQAIFFLIALSVSQFLFSQEWTIPIELEEGWGVYDVVPVDGRASALGIGCTYTNNGLLIKANEDGSYLYRTVHLPGMMLRYHSALQLTNGNYMVFGICDDSLCDPHIQRYLKVDVFDSQLQPVSTRTFSVDDEVFDCFSFPNDGMIMNSILSRSRNALLVALPAFYVDQFGGYYKSAIRFYEFDNLGDTIRTIDNSTNMSSVRYLKEITYEPHSDNLMMVVDGGNFGYDSGIPGIYVADADLNIITHQSMLHFGGAEIISDNACEGRWFDGNHIIMDCEQYIGSHFTYHTLFVADSALNVYAELRLPPEDSCAWVPNGTSTAYINDSTIFAVTYCAHSMGEFDTYQANVILIDKHLNLLGRKAFRRDHVTTIVRQPVAFDDGGCLIPLFTSNGSNYPGEAFFQGYLMKFRREDIEITWDVVNENNPKPTSSVYPNPSQSIVNITIDEVFTLDARIQIFDAKGVKCLDSEVGGTGNLITLDIHNLDAGLYVYKIVSDNQELASGKFIKY